MAQREEKFEDVIDYDKVDKVISQHYEDFIEKNKDVTASEKNADDRKVNLINQLFLFSGGSATTVGALVKDEMLNGGFADSAFKIDSELVAEWDVVRNLSHDAKLTKHAEKLTPLDIIRGNTAVARLFEAEDVSKMTPPYKTTQTHLLNLPFFGEVSVPKGYVFSDSNGRAFFSGERHDEAFQALLRYVGKKVFEVAESHDLKTTLIIDDHLEDLPTVENIISSAKEYDSQTIYIQSYVKPEVAIERGAQRFANEGKGEDISYRINRYMQMRTHLHQPRNWQAIRGMVDGSILTHRNIEGAQPVIVQRCFKDKDEQLHIRTGENKQGWYDSFMKIDGLPKDPEKALYELGFAPSTSKFASFAALSKGNDSTAAERLAAQRDSLSGWKVEGRG